MSKIALSGNASGTGTFTIESPNTNTNYTLTLPEASGTLATGSLLPPGSVLWYAANTPPTGYLKANGAAVSRTTYAALFAVLVKSSTVTITIATPGVVTWTNHGLSANDPVQFTTTGALPTGLTAGVVYYVVGGASLTTDTFRVSASAGGAAINTTGSQSGTQTAINAPYGIGDGSTTFNLPNLCGEFVRGWDDGRGVDTDRSFGSNQGQAIQAHTHTQTGSTLGPAAGVFAFGSGSGAAAIQATASTGGTETRPRNVALLACIKF